MSWQAPSAIDHNGILVAFTIYVQAVGGGFTDNTVKQKQVPAPLTEAYVTGLEAYVKYNIKVSASTGVGEGSFSASVNVRTKEAGKNIFISFLPSFRPSFLLSVLPSFFPSFVPLLTLSVIILQDVTLGYKEGPRPNFVHP